MFFNFSTANMNYIIWITEVLNYHVEKTGDNEDWTFTDDEKDRTKLFRKVDD